jgi:predicted O-methyltransferase YrrM
VHAIRRDLLRGESRQPVRELLNWLYANEVDPNLDQLWQVYEAADTSNLAYWDVRTAVRVVARHLRPRTYLEVGTRRGWSVVQAFAECPDLSATCFDIWEPDYGGTQQGSPELVRAKVQTVVGPGRLPQLEFVSGDSHQTLPKFLAEQPGSIDLVVVDGDHSRLGAWWDLCDLFPRVSLGGALVFDDLEYSGDEDIGRPLPVSGHPRPALPAGLSSLGDVWLQMQVLQPNFLFLAAPVLRFRAGVALRLV